MPYPKRIDERREETSTVIKDDDDEKVTETVTIVERDYDDGSSTRDMYTDYNVEKPDGTSYTWHGSLHNSGQENLDLQTDSGTYHEHDKDEDGNYQKSFWKDNND